MTLPDLSNASAEDLRALIAAATERLESMKQQLVEEAAAHGLKLVTPKKPAARRNSPKNEEA